MARIRTIKPEFWTDEVTVELDFADRLLFIGLWNFVDDQGFMPLRVKRIKMQIFPGDEYDVEKGLRTLWESSLVSLYDHPEGLILHVTNWVRHQKISNPSRERYSRSDLRKQTEWSTSSLSPLESYPAEGKGREGKGRETTSSAIADAIPDQPREDVQRLCALLADCIVTNGAKRPNVGKSWHDSARLLMDKDGRSEADIAWLIEWATSDSFWKANILSMPTLREKFDQLWIKANANNVRPIRTDDQGRTILPPLPSRSPWGPA